MKKFFALAALIAASSSTHAQEFKGNFVSDTVFSVAEAVSSGVSNSVTGIKDTFKGWDGPIGYPGNTWGTLVYGAKAPDGYQKYRVEGIVEQGIDWFRFSSDKRWKFNTYVAGEYALNDTNNSFTPVLGMKVNRAFSDGSLDLGLRYKYGNTYLSPTGVSNPGGTEKVSRVEVYATYWFAWDLKGKN